MVQMNHKMAIANICSQWSGPSARWDYILGNSWHGLHMMKSMRLRRPQELSNVQVAMLRIWLSSSLVMARSKVATTSWRRVPRNGPPSLLMPPSPPLPQACYARTHHPTTTSMASNHHVANSSPTCHESQLPPAEPQPPLKEHGLDLATSPPLAWRLTSKTVTSLPGGWPVQQSFRCFCLETAQYNSPRPRSSGKKVRRKKKNISGIPFFCSLVLGWISQRKHLGKTQYGEHKQQQTRPFHEKESNQQTSIAKIFVSHHMFH